MPFYFLLIGMKTTSSKHTNVSKIMIVFLGRDALGLVLILLWRNGSEVIFWADEFKF